MTYVGIKMAEEAAETYGYKVNEKFHKIFTEYHKTHNQAVFDAYTPEMRAFLLMLLMLPTSFGANYRSFRRWSVKRAAYLSARQKLYQALQLMALDTSMSL